MTGRWGTIRLPPEGLSPALLNLTSAGTVVRMQQVTIATGAVVSADVVVTEMIAEQVFVGALGALVYIWTQRKKEHDISNMAANVVNLHVWVESTEGKRVEPWRRSDLLGL